MHLWFSSHCKQQTEAQRVSLRHGGVKTHFGDFIIREKIYHIKKIHFSPNRAGIEELLFVFIA